MAPHHTDPVLYCSSLSSYNFHVDLYIGILATPIILWDLVTLAKQHETKLISILYCSLMSSACVILLINEQLRLPYRLRVLYCFERIIEQLRLPCRLLVLYCSKLAVLSLYCSWMSRCDFRVILWHYCHILTSVGSCCVFKGAGIAQNL
jgi:hypothetical protein